MCTVSYIPTDKGVLLTSNRDERIDRAAALPPAVYKHHHQRVWYPRDTEAGGTWVALRNDHSAAVLLNGGFEKHTRKPRYRKSRGLVMLDIVEGDEPLRHFLEMDLEDIEPFTLILFTCGHLRRCTWDGAQKHIRKLDPGRAHIWSSATLYGPDVQQERERMLDEWLSQYPELNTESVLGFHLSDPIRYEASPACVHPHMQTVSVTAMELPVDGRCHMHYRDLRRQPVGEGSDGEPFDFNSLYWKARRFMIRLRHWEYWPMLCVYPPLTPLWLWLSLRARSLLFFSGANPGIAYSGFIHERKSDIYPLLPTGLYPETILCKVGTSADEIYQELTRRSLVFPLIAKPDIGERGMQVKLLRTRQELESYRLSSQVDFLLQEYIDYENEVGIFYYRLPGAPAGHISGMVGKEFLRVSGDGRRTLLSLLMQNDRAILQLPALTRAYEGKLNRIPALGENLTLVPYGNHSRGARFIDLQSRITPQLTTAIDQICKQVPGFFFGRLDIRFKSWEDLEAGQNLSIIELNGTGSEPTHIYDPGHSLLFAWKEIYRHWKIASRISVDNVRNGGTQMMTIGEARRMHRMHRKHLALLKTP